MNHIATTIYAILMALFGTNAASEQNTERAIETGLEMLVAAVGAWGFGRFDKGRIGY